MKSLTNLAQRQKDIQEQVKKLAQDSVAPALREALTDLQAAVPSLVGIQWTQYTPFFNDGEECTFGLHGTEFDTGKGFDYVSTYEGCFDKTTGLNKGGLNRTQAETLGRSSSNLGDICDMLKVAFGDHTQVTLTREGIETESHEDHD